MTQRKIKSCEGCKYANWTNDCMIDDCLFDDDCKNWKPRKKEKEIIVEIYRSTDEELFIFGKQIDPWLNQYGSIKRLIPKGRTKLFYLTPKDGGK